MSAALRNCEELAYSQPFPARLVPILPPLPCLPPGAEYPITGNIMQTGLGSYHERDSGLRHRLATGTWHHYGGGLGEGRAAGCQAKRTAADDGRLPSTLAYHQLLSLLLSFSSFGGQKFSPPALRILACKIAFRQLEWEGVWYFIPIPHEEHGQPRRVSGQGMPGNKRVPPLGRADMPAS